MPIRATSRALFGPGEEERMRNTLCALGLVVAIGGLALGGGSAMAAGTPQRPAGPVVPVAPSENGGDNGWGNCGHNSSGGIPPGEGGNGGYSKGDCGPVSTDPSDEPGDVPS